MKCVALKVSLSAVDRALRIYDALFKALEARGHRVTLVAKDNETSTVVHVDGEQVGIEIQEHVTRTEVPPLKPQTGWYSKKYVWEATGRLTLVLTDSFLSVRGKWSDGARQNLDEMLNEIVVGLGDAADAIKSRREAFERAERERQAAEVKRREAEERARRERGKARAAYSGQSGQPIRFNSARRSDAIRPARPVHFGRGSGGQSRATTCAGSVSVVMSSRGRTRTWC
jgi:hypothetical protein